MKRTIQIVGADGQVVETYDAAVYAVLMSPPTTGELGYLEEIRILKAEIAKRDKRMRQYEQDSRLRARV